MALHSLTQPTYAPPPAPLAGSTPWLDSMARGFLGLVQPNAFPAELLSRLIQEPTRITEPAMYKQVLSYETGFLVCAAIGLLFILLMPLGGLCFCCCRCCGRCGGRKYQKQDERTGCRRRALCTTLLLLSGLLLAWNVCAFVTNTRISRAVGSSFVTFNSSVRNLSTYLDDIPQQVDFVVNSSRVPLGQANDSLRDISSVLGSAIVSSVGRELQRALDGAAHLLEDLGVLRTDLQKVINSSQQLQDTLDGISRNLSALCSRIERSLQSCGQPCEPWPHCPRVPANLSLVPNVGHQLDLLENLTRSDPQAVIQQANRSLHDMPQRVENETRDLVVEAQAQLDQIRGELRQMRARFSILDTLSNVSATLHNVTRSAAHYEPLVQTADHYRWIACVCLCCLVLLVVLSYALGLALGVLGLNPAALPVDRGCLPNAGGNLLLAGVGFSFLFSWLLMLLVLLSFLLAGNGYVLVCRSWHNRQLLQFLETQGMIPQTLWLHGQPLNLSHIYNACQHDAPLWSVLDMGQTVSLDKLLNLSQYTTEIRAAFAKTNLTLVPVVLLSTEQTGLLRALGNTTRLANLTADRQKLSTIPSGEQLLGLANELDRLADTRAANSSEELRGEAEELRQLGKEMETRLRRNVSTLNKTLQRLQERMHQLPMRVDSALEQMKQAEAFLDTRVAATIQNESQLFLHRLLGFFETYVAWVKGILTGELGRCGPAAQALDGVETIACHYVLDSLNAFWFSLGACTVLLLPGLVLATRLAKFYRRMDYADVHENNALEMFAPPPAFKIPRVETRP